MSINVSELLVETLARAGVKRILAVVGDSLDGIADAVRRRDDIQWITVRHEEVAAFAAGAEAHLTGTLAVCAGSCGPGNTHLINGLYDCHRSRVPVLAIAAHIPSAEIGSRYFQETHPEIIFRECSSYCELVSHPSQMPRVLEIAIQTAIGHRAVAVVVLPGDVALMKAEHKEPRVNFRRARPVVRPSDEELDLLAGALNGKKKITILGGAGCAGAHDGAGGAGRTLAGTHCPCVARQRVYRVRQSVRRGHERIAGHSLGLSGDGKLRGAAHAGHRFSLPAVLSHRGLGRARWTCAPSSWAAAPDWTSVWWETSKTPWKRFCPA